VKYGLKIFKLFFTIIVIVYFLSLGFLIWCEITLEWWPITEEGHEDSFIHYFGFTDKTANLTTLTIIYYGLTSLSTVGLGDLHPRSNAERLLVAFLLIGGVAIFSYIMGNFIELGIQFSSLTDELQEDE